MKKIILSCLIALIACVLHGCYSVEQSTVERGYRWITRGEYSRAINTFSSALNDNPHNVLALVGRGDAYAEQKEYLKAFTDYDLAISCWEQNRASKKNGLPEETVPSTSETYGKKPFSYQNQGLTVKYGLGAHLYYHRGVAWHEYSRDGEWYESDRLNKAATDFSKAIQLAPNLVAAYINRGSIYTMLGKLDLALADYEQVLKLTPQDEKAKQQYQNIKNQLDGAKQK